jgi:hypothetical protein
MGATEIATWLVGDSALFRNGQLLNTSHGGTVYTDLFGIPGLRWFFRLFSPECNNRYDYNNVCELFLC